MSGSMTLDISQHEREILLQGLRFVRSYVMLEIRDPSPEADEQRARKLKEIDALSAQLQAQNPAEQARI